MIKPNPLLNLLVLLPCALPIAAQTQNPPPKNAPVPFMAPLQASQADQENFPPQLIEALTAIKTAALADDYAYRQVAYLTENIGPRPSGSLQAKAAVEYVAAELRQLAGATQKVVLAALGGSTSTPADGITAEVVVVNTFDELKALGHDKVAGK